MDLYRQTMELKKKQFVVIGINGYLGRHLAAQLQEDGHEVFGYDIQPRCSLDSISYQPLDVTDPKQWTSVATDVENICVFSGLTGTHSSFDQYFNYIAVNELGLACLLNLLRLRGHRPRIIFPSSRLVYRGSPEPLAENAPKESKTVYAANKLAAEGFLHAYHAAFDIPYTIFRICVPYGNRWNGPYSYGTTGAFIRMAREKNEITLFGDGSLRRTFSHAQDICAQIVACSHRTDCIAQTYNIAGEAFSLLQVASWIGERFGARILHTPWPAREIAIESGDTVFDDSTIRSLIPIPLRFSLHDWIASADFND